MIHRYNNFYADTSLGIKESLFKLKEKKSV